MSSPDATATDTPDSETLSRLFAICERSECSDIHIAAGQPPWMRLRGVMNPVERSLLSGDAVRKAAASLAALTLPPEKAAAMAADGGIAVDSLLASGAIDGACSSRSGTRYRFNIFRESAGCAIALRRLDESFRSFAQLQLPDTLGEFCRFRDGLAIVTGPTGSGKSTTLATIIDILNHTREGHIVTIEDPVEYIHHSAKCLVRQRQIGRDARSFNSALVEALRQDPDIILVGEIRDLDTIRTAITAAETGHLVFTTLHAGDCAGAVERIISVFPAGEQDGIRHQLAMVLRGIFAQHLVATQDGTGRVPACELMIATPAIANLVATGRTNQLASAIETGGAMGMFTLDQSLSSLVAAGRISPSAAMGYSRNPDTLAARTNRIMGVDRHG